MTEILRFGIPSLDHLFGKRPPEVADTKEKTRLGEEETDELQYEPEKHGIHLPGEGSASMCIIGPDGTGKSVLALHLASSYMSDCIRQSASEVPRVLYVSTDLKFEMAKTMWENFALDFGALRRIPFSDERVSFSDERRKAAPVGPTLVPCEPLGIERPGEDLRKIEGEKVRRLASVLAESGNPASHGIYFVDLASRTAGDDWGFINRVLAVLDPPCGDKAPSHLLIIDSVEGFETLVGERDAFGEAHPRRSRVAQVMRSAANKCHIVFIVEEKREGERLPEEFVTDVVIRLRNTSAKDYVRRTIEIEKSRGQSHVRGQHSYVIRAGTGSSTGLAQNQDDPVVLLRVGSKSYRHQSYVHVCPSLHRIGRGVMESTGKGIPPKDAKRYAGFGIFYLDDMLAGTDEPLVEPGSDTRGLPCSTTTALMGDPETQKTQLGFAFLSRSFKNYAKRLCEVVKVFENPRDNVEYLPTLLEAVAMRLLWKHSARFIEDLPRVLYDENWKFKDPFDSLSKLSKWLEGRPRNSPPESPLERELRRLLAPPAGEAPDGDWKQCIAPLREALDPQSKQPSDRSLSTLLEAVVSKLLWYRSADFIKKFRALFYDPECNLKTPFDKLQGFSYWLESGQWENDLKRRFRPPEDEKWEQYVVGLRDWLRHESEPSYVTTLESDLKKDLERYRKLGHEKDQQEYLEKDRLHRAVVNAAWLLCEPYHIHDGVPVLLTTKDTNVERLSNAFLRLLVRESPELTRATEESRRHNEYSESPIEKALKLHIQEFTVCRRLEIHDLPSPVLIHILQRNVEAAQRFLFHDRIPKDTRRRFEESWRIRLVIDDFSILRKTHPEISEEPLVLPFIMFYLRREGITSLVIDTEAGSPNIPATELEKELRTLIHHHLYTWRFPFYGENRIAIAAIPPISNDLPAVVRELRERQSAREPKSGEDTPTRHPEKRAIYIEESELDVDPHLELYSGIEEGKPEPVPLEVRLYAETPPIRQYIRDENVRYRELFKPASGGVGRQAGDVMRPMQADEYEVFKDFCHLQRDTRLDHTLVCQVDEFWSLRRPGVRRAGAFRPQNKYLDSPTVDDEGKINRAVDPFGVFQITGQEQTSNVATTRHRSDFFGNSGYQPDYPPDDKKGDRVRGFTDRVPFVWDFGFLLCRKRLWERYSDQELSATEDKGPTKIGDVWDRLPNIVKSDDVVSKILNQLKALQQQADAKTKIKVEHCTNEIEALTRREEYFTIVRPSLDERLRDFVELSPRDVGRLRRVLQGSDFSTPKPRTKRPSWRVFLEACSVIAQKEGSRTPAFDLSLIAQQSLACLILEIWASEIYSSLPSDRQPDFANKISRRARAASSGGADDIGLIEWLRPGEDCYRLQLYKSWLLLVEVLNIPELAAAVRKGGVKGRKGERSAVAARYWYKTAWASSHDASHDDPVVPVGLPGHFAVRGDWFLAVASGSRSERLADRALDLLNSRRSNFSRLEQGIGLPTRDIGEGHVRTSLVTVGRAGRPTKVTYSELCSLGAPLSTSEDNQFHWLWRSRLKHYSRHTRVFEDWLNQTILWWDVMRHTYKGDDWMSGFKRYDEVSRGDDLRQIESWQKFQSFLDSLTNRLLEANPVDHSRKPRGRSG